MKTYKVICLLAALLLFPAYSYSSSLGNMRISLIKGDVQVKTPEAGDWGIASINGPLMEGDQVWVPQGGKAELQLNTGTYIRLDQNSALQILSMDKDSSQFYLSQGHAYIFYDAPTGSVIQVDTPDASTRAFNRAIFRIDMSDQYTDVAVYKGYVETENKVGKTRINAGEMLSLGQDTDGEVAPMGPPDAWEKWNKRRNDKLFARRGVSSHYLPAEISAYSYDFDSYGRWVEVPDYGYVWTPTITVGVSWSPYRHGRWIWWGGDYVWVAYEPWGWAPYHYGRWSFVVSIGWCWVPPVAGAVYWAPGYVGWVRTADYVAWVPLAPGEVYYGRGYYGPHSVNITNININQVNITNVYKNVYINNGVTVVNRNTFATSSPKFVSVNQNIIQQQIFAKNNISVGTPAIKPTRASYFMSAKPISAAMLPPQSVRNLQVMQLKQSRPLVKDPGMSVLNPGSSPKPLSVNTVTTPRTPGMGKPMVQPTVKGKSAGPEGGLTPRGEKQQVKPSERKSAGPESGLTPKVEKQQVKPSERKSAGPESGLTPKVEKQQVKPSERKSAGPESGLTPKVEKQQVKPSERKSAGPEGVLTPRGEKQQVKPSERKSVGPEGLTPRGEKQQVKPSERKSVGPEGLTPRGEKQQVKPSERKSAGPEGVLTPRGEKQPAAEGTQKGQKKQGTEEIER